MTKPLTTKQVSAILAAEPASKRCSYDVLERLVRRIEWEHKIGEDPCNFTKLGVVRQKDQEEMRRLSEKVPNEKKWNAEKLSELLASYRAGEKPVAIAERLGLTRQRVYELIRKAEREEEEKKNPKPPLGAFDGLSTRARNAILSAIDLPTLHAAHALLDSGEKISGAGNGTLYEVKKFLYQKGFRFKDGWAPL